MPLLWVCIVTLYGLVSVINRYIHKNKVLYKMEEIVGPGENIYTEEFDNQFHNLDQKIDIPNN